MGIYVDEEDKGAGRRKRCIQRVITNPPTYSIWLVHDLSSSDFTPIKCYMLIRKIPSSARKHLVGGDEEEGFSSSFAI